LLWHVNHWSVRLDRSIHPSLFWIRQLYRRSTEMPEIIAEDRSISGAAQDEQLDSIVPQEPGMLQSLAVFSWYEKRAILIIALWIDGLVLVNEGTSSQRVVGQVPVKNPGMLG
jgi:hypothetical protein